VVSALWIEPETITLAPSSATSQLGTSYTATAYVASGGAPAAGAPVVFTVLAGPNSGKTLSATTERSGHAAFTYTSNTIGVDVIAATTGSVASNQVVARWITIPTLLTWTGSVAGETNDPVTLGARLTEATTSNPVAGQTLTFNFGEQSLTATTDANGTASVSTAASMTQYLNIVRDESSIAITSNPNVAEGMSQIVTALLPDSDGGAPLVGRAVTFTIGAVTATATTDANGIAAAAITIPISFGTGPIARVRRRRE